MLVQMRVFVVEKIMMYVWILCALTPPTVPIEHHILHMSALSRWDAGVVGLLHLNVKCKKKHQLLKSP